jgi:coatomer subunit beta'
LHPTEPWVLSSLYNGKVTITNYETNTVIKTFDVSDQPVRCACFVVRKQWIMCGSDDMRITIYNYNTLDKVHSFDAHQDFVRCIAVHPSSPLFLTSSDDFTIKLWNFDTWKLVRTFEGHSHYTMHVAFNPKDPSIFATASLDHNVKIWNINSSQPNMTLSGHAKGVNHVDFCWSNDKPFIISCSDDQTAKVWDYGTKACIQTLEGHSNNVSVCCFHPKLPIIITGSEDGTLILWNSITYKVEDTLNYGLERVWCVAYTTDTKIAVGYDDGTVVVKLGKETPIVNMDDKGKIILAVHNEITSLSIKGGDSNDGEKVATVSKDLGTLELYPIRISHDPSGRYCSVSGDGEYMIYNSASWRNKSFGEGEEMVWGHSSGQFAVKDKSGKLKVFLDFVQSKIFKPLFYPEAIFGGGLLGVKSKNMLCFYDWESCELVRSIEVTPTNLYWNEAGDAMILVTEGSFFLLTCDSKLISSVRGKIGEEGLEDAISLVREVSERVEQGQWVGDCFVFVNNNNKLNYYIGEEVVTLAHLDKESHLLGYVPKNNRIYLMEKDLSIISYQLHLSVLAYETAIVKGDMEAAEKLLVSVPNTFFNQLARFVDGLGHKKLAISLTSDPEHKFQLAVEIGDLDICLEIVKKTPSDTKWKQLGGISLSTGNFKLAEECMMNGKDYNGLLLLYTSLGNRKGIETLSNMTLKEGKNSLSFLCCFLLGKVDICLTLLIDTNRLPEATFFARTYLPRETARIVGLWKESLLKTNPKVAERLADPIDFPNLFPDFSLIEEAEKLLLGEKEIVSALEYSKYAKRSARNVIEELKSKSNGVPQQEQVEIVDEVTVATEEGVEVSSIVQEDVQEVVPQEKPKKKGKNKKD